MIKCDRFGGSISRDRPLFLFNDSWCCDSNMPSKYIWQRRPHMHVSQMYALREEFEWSEVGYKYEAHAWPCIQLSVSHYFGWMVKCNHYLMLDLIWFEHTRQVQSAIDRCSTSIYNTLATYGIYKYAINSKASTIHINMIETLVLNLWNSFRFSHSFSLVWFLAFSLSLNRI